MSSLDELLLRPQLAYVEDQLEGRRVLLIGPGSGVASRWISHGARAITILEPSRARARYFSRRFPARNVTCVHGSLTSSSLAAQAFDVVLALGPSVPIDEAFVSEIHRVLSPEGFLFLNPAHTAIRQPAQGATRLGDLLRRHFPNVEVLVHRTSLDVFVGTDPRRLPTFVMEPGQAQIVSREIFLCSHLQILPEEQLVARFEPEQFLAPLRARLRRNRIRLQETTDTLEQLGEALNQNYSDDLTGVIDDSLASDARAPGSSAPGMTVELEDGGELRLDGTRSAFPVGPEGQQGPYEPSGSEEITVKTTLAQLVSSGIPKKNSLTDEIPDPEITLESGDHQISDLSGVEEIEPAHAPPLDSFESAAEEERSPGELEVSSSAIESEDAEGSGHDGDAPASLEQAALKIAEEIELFSATPSEDDGPEETPFEGGLEGVESTEPIPPRRRHIAAAIAAPYEALTQGSEDFSAKENQAERDEDGVPIPEVPLPSIDVRKELLEGWDTPPEPAGDTDSRDEDFAPLPSLVRDRTENTSGDMPGRPGASLAGGIGNTVSDGRHLPTESTAAPLSRRQRGEQILMEALRSENLEHLPNVTQPDLAVPASNLLPAVDDDSRHADEPGRSRDSEPKKSGG